MAAGGGLMAQALLVLAVLVALASLPVMLAARWLGAGRSSLGAALLANLLSGAVTALLANLLPALGWASAVLAIGAASAVFALVLDTGWFRGFLIGLLSTLLTAVALVLVAGSALVPGGA
jgi:hypothetical protein